MSYAFYFDGSKCTGCKTCELACKDFNDLDLGIAFRRVYEYSGGEFVEESPGCFTQHVFGYYVSDACNHCDNPACVHICPTGAMHKDDETGLVSVNSERCIGCGYCHMACPYNAPQVDREKKHSVKCDGCASRVKEGKRPICVEACPVRALDFGEVQDMEKKGARANIAPLPDPSLTSPNFFVNSCRDAQPSGSRAGKIVNPLEVL